MDWAKTSRRDEKHLYFWIGLTIDGSFVQICEIREHWKNGDQYEMMVEFLLSTLQTYRGTIHAIYTCGIFITYVATKCNNREQRTCMYPSPDMISAVTWADAIITNYICLHSVLTSLILSCVTKSHVIHSSTMILTHITLVITYLVIYWYEILAWSRCIQMYGAAASTCMLIC